MHVLKFHELDRTHVAIVGGKGANLGELSRIDGIRVPPGFCITTRAFTRIMRSAPAIDARLARLSHLAPTDRDAIAACSAEIRRTIEGIVIPDDLAAEITGALDERTAYAVRSSATAEDLPTASFAGQQDSFLNIAGAAAILEHVRRVWASLFTDRAVTYRLRNGFDHAKVRMAVVVQEMAFARSAGILFTADPVTSNRNIVSIDAALGLGEALVSGLVNADVFKVRGDSIVTKITAREPALTDAQALRLARLGRMIEAHFGSPQDIEWCLVDDDFQFVQSRPITTLFPIPAARDAAKHVYLSVGHQQMMTDAMKPLGLSVWLLTTRAPMVEAGGRLFVDITRALASPAGRAGLVNGFTKADPLTGDALRTIVERGFIESIVDDKPPGPPPPAPPPIETDPAIVTDLIAQNQASVAALARDIDSQSGPALFEFILTDLRELQRLLFDPRTHQTFMAAIDATTWLDDRLYAWLGEKHAADTLAQSVPNNVTSEMGLALLDVADAIRPHPDVVAFLEHVEGDDFLDDLTALDGGREARDAIDRFLDRYGMRCAGEIDITRPRWTERPSTLVPLILHNAKHFELGAGARRFAAGRDAAATKEHELLAHLRALPDGEQRADETKRMIDRVRTFIGYREYPKYGMVSRYAIYKQALLAEADRLVQAGVLRARDDIFFLTLQELHEVARTNRVDDQLIRAREAAFRSYRALTPPRVLTSDGECISGAYRRDDLPAGALIGLAVSAGTVEGRARVVLDMAAAELEAGDILVTTFTDPSWTPLFVAIAGLVTEVGGVMTHGAVIAREYGLPAVVGVERATRRIRDGQRIRVHGTDGYVEILTDVQR